MQKRLIRYNDQFGVFLSLTRRDWENITLIYTKITIMRSLVKYLVSIHQLTNATHHGFKYFP